MLAGTTSIVSKDAKGMRLVHQQPRVVRGRDARHLIERRDLTQGRIHTVGHNQSRLPDRGVTLQQLLEMAEVQVPKGMALEARRCNCIAQAVVRELIEINGREALVYCAEQSKSEQVAGGQIEGRLAAEVGCPLGLNLLQRLADEAKVA